MGIIDDRDINPQMFNCVVRGFILGIQAQT